MKTAAVAAIIIMAGSGPAFAQSPPTLEPGAPICWVGGLPFSPGATARTSSTVMVCGANGAWTASNEDASGCMAEGKFSNTLSREGVTSTKAVSVECQADGRQFLSTLHNGYRSFTIRDPVNAVQYHCGGQLCEILLLQMIFGL